MQVKRGFMYVEEQHLNGPELKRYKDMTEQMQGVIDDIIEELIQLSFNNERTRVRFCSDKYDDS
eukprot:5927854-Amphidinium_carterae.2